MSQTNPTAVDALPTAPSTASPSTFAALADAFVAALATFRTQINNIATNVYDNAVDCYNNAVAAAASASASAASAGITKWISGTSYTEGDGVWSPANFQSYRRKVTGGGTTDPSADSTNWALIGIVGTASADVASAATVNLSTTSGTITRITGTTATSAFTMNSGQWHMCIADGAWPLTYHATTNKLNTGGLSYTCTPGDRLILVKDDDGIIQVMIIPTTVVGETSGQRNPVTNGGFQIDTRNEAATQNITSTLTKCFDNWSVMTGSAHSGTLTVAQGSLSAGTAQSNKCAVLLRSTGTYADDLRMVHVIPTADAQKYAGRTIKVGFKAQKHTDWQGGNIKMDIFTGTGTDQGSASLVAGSWTTSAMTTPVDTAITTSMVEYTGTVAIPAGTTEIAIRMRTGIFSGSGSGNDYALITDVFFDQLDSRTLDVERMLCGNRLRLIAGGPVGRAEATTKSDVGIFIEPPMASAPTASVLGTIRMRNLTTGVYTTATTPSLAGASIAKGGGYIEVGASSWSSALAVGDITVLACDAAKSGILLSSEL